MLLRFFYSVIDNNTHSMHNEDVYMKYIFPRPRVEKHGGMALGHKPNDHKQQAQV